MTGKDMVEAMSFVEEKYIDEAEHGEIRKVNRIRYLLPLAACFCLILLGSRVGLPAPESAEPLPGEAPDAAGMEIVEMQKDHSWVVDEDIAVEEIVVPNASEVPSVILRIQEWTDSGFIAEVVEYTEAEFVPLGTVLTVELLSNICVEAIEGDMVTVQRRLPTEAEFPTGTLVRVRFQSYSVEDNILLIESICKEVE